MQRRVGEDLKGRLKLPAFINRKVVLVLVQSLKERTGMSPAREIWAHSKTTVVEGKEGCCVPRQIQSGWRGKKRETAVHKHQGGAFGCGSPDAAVARFALSGTRLGCQSPDKASTSIIKFSQQTRSNPDSRVKTRQLFGYRDSVYSIETICHHYLTFSCII
jgi:hypothetical protein